MSRPGLERTTKMAEKQGVMPERGTESGTLPDDPELADVVKAWPTLPEPIRRAVLALIGAAK